MYLLDGASKGPLLPGHLGLKPLDFHRLLVNIGVLAGTRCGALLRGRGPFRLDEGMAAVCMLVHTRRAAGHQQRVLCRPHSDEAHHTPV